MRVLSGRGEEARVAAYGLLSSERPDHRFLDLDFEPVDIPVAGDALARFVAVARQHGFDRRGERRLRVARHVEQRHFELGELVVKVAMARCLGVQPNLPVMYASVRSSVGRVKTCSVSPNSTKRTR